MVECDPESGTVCFTRRAIHLQPRSRRLFLCTIYRNRARTSPGNVRIWGMRDEASLGHVAHLFGNLKARPSCSLVRVCRGLISLEWMQPESRSSKLNSCIKGTPNGAKRIEPDVSGYAMGRGTAANTPADGDGGDAGARRGGRDCGNGWLSPQGGRWLSQTRQSQREAPEAIAAQSGRLLA
jgi:hypothetical protein